MPLDAYRGAGKPEANFVAERLIDEAARQLGLPPEELRRRNLIAEDELPHTGALGYTLDSGRFEESLAVTIDAADLAGFPARRKKSLKAGKHRGAMA